MDAIIVVVCVLALYFWFKEHAKKHAAKVADRQEACDHPPESQRTIRVNSILTINPVLIHKVIPGRRWLIKHCDRCGKQWPMYSPQLQPWDDYKAEWDQETLDRNAQYEARKAKHINEERERERRRLEQRDKDHRGHNRSRSSDG